MAPVIELLDKKFGVVKGFMTTVHAMTNDQETLDLSHKKGIYSRRGRAASANIIPTSTGAASQIGKVIPHLNGKMDGVAFRVPVIDGSVVDITLELEKALNSAGFYSADIEVVLDGKSYSVVCQDVQFHPVSDMPLHVDFLRK